MTVFQKLAKRIKNDLDLELHTFERVRAGYWQRSSGAWSWRALCNGIAYDFGSQYSAAALLKAKRIELNGYEIECYDN